MDNLVKAIHKDYSKVDSAQPDCPICLVDFKPEDELIVFACDEKHYFHTKCGMDWLEVKTECPLCRTDYTEEIHKLVE